MHYVMPKKEAIARTLVELVLKHALMQGNTYDENSPSAEDAPEIQFFLDKVGPVHAVVGYTCGELIVRVMVAPCVRGQRMLRVGWSTPNLLGYACATAAAYVVLDKPLIEFSDRRYMNCYQSWCGNHDIENELLKLTDPRRLSKAVKLSHHLLYA